MKRNAILINQKIVKRVFTEFNFLDIPAVGREKIVTIISTTFDKLKCILFAEM